jgi:heme-degrading monooxygenase HmoA
MQMSETVGEYVVMNVVQVPISGADGFEQAFAKRQSALNEVDGFRGFELLKRDDGEEFLVISRWKNEEAFLGWRNGQDFKKAHANAAPDKAPEGHRPSGSEVRNYTVLLSEPATA